jgi:hypothetical protein
MRRSLRRAWLVPAALLLVSLSCSESTGPDSVAPGQVAFDFVGDTAGHFSANGALTVAPDSTIRRPFAVARRLVTGGLLLCAFSPAAPSLGDAFALNLGVAPGPGTYALPVPPAGPPTWLTPGHLLLGEDLAGGTRQRSLALITGEVTIHDTTGGRVRGTFSGLFGNLDPRYTPVDTVRVPSATATFDVPVVPEAALYAPESPAGQVLRALTCTTQ